MGVTDRLQHRAFYLGYPLVAIGLSVALVRVDFALALGVLALLLTAYEYVITAGGP